MIISIGLAAPRSLALCTCPARPGKYRALREWILGRMAKYGVCPVRWTCLGPDVSCPVAGRRWVAPSSAGREQPRRQPGAGGPVAV